MKTLIVIPARYASTRFPGKPLALIGGVAMLSRVHNMAIRAKNMLGDQSCEVLVATDDDRIATHCTENGFNHVMTDAALPSGTDRAHAAAIASNSDAEVIVNLQGDAPFTPAEQIASVAKAATEHGVDAATPFVQLSWEALDALRQHKEKTPFSGTTLVCDDSGKALWFSKNILPAMRKEAKLRDGSDLSPVKRHIGLYALRREALDRYVTLKESHYEALEGLEQLRMLENGMHIKCVRVDPPRVAIPGIDTPEDLALAEKLLAEHGDPMVES